MTAPETQAARRRKAVQETLSDIRRILGNTAPSRALLQQVTQTLEQLARQEDLFSLREFPLPEEGAQTSSRYRLNSDDGDDDLALYLNILPPAKSTLPHNHTTWAAIVAVEGQELNRVYERQDDAKRADRATLRLLREVVVEPGTPIAFLADDVHSIHVTGNRPTRHLHLYGRPLETLVRRVAIDPETGIITNYNATQMLPSEVRP